MVDDGQNPALLEISPPHHPGILQESRPTLATTRNPHRWSTSWQCLPSSGPTDSSPALLSPPSHLPCSNSSESCAAPIAAPRCCATRERITALLATPSHRPHLLDADANLSAAALEPLPGRRCNRRRSWGRWRPAQHSEARRGASGCFPGARRHGEADGGGGTAYPSLDKAVTTRGGGRGRLPTRGGFGKREMRAGEPVLSGRRRAAPEGGGEARARPEQARGGGCVSRRRRRRSPRLG